MVISRTPEVLVELDPSSDEPLYLQIYNQVCEAIKTRKLREGDHLPSIRAFAEEHDVSHTTVEKAYSQLVTEGYVSNVPRSGYVVEHVDAEFLNELDSGQSEELQKIIENRDTNAFYFENAVGKTARYDFSYANLQPCSFPVGTWRKLVNDVLYKECLPDFDNYVDVTQTRPINHEIARYLAQARGMICLPEQVVLRPGTDGAITTILELFDRESDVFGMEEPGYATVREVASRLGFKIVGLPSDQGSAAFIEAVRTHNPKIVFTTPSHQFPTGRMLPIEGRIELLQWAQENDAYIIEDDSCNEYRYGTHPVRSLHSLDRYDHVIYLCNFSKVLSPSLRIAYIVLPPHLLEAFFRSFNHTHPSTPILEQEVLARFMHEGYWAQQVRRMARGNKQRHDLLLECLRRDLGNMIEVAGKNSGMHFYVTVNNRMLQDELIDSAAAEDVAVYGTKRFWFSRPAPENKLMIGFSAIALDDIPEGVRRLARAWRV